MKKKIPLICCIHIYCVNMLKMQSVIRAEPQFFPCSVTLFMNVSIQAVPNQALERHLGGCTDSSTVKWALFYKKLSPALIATRCCSRAGITVSHHGITDQRK